MGPVWMSAHGIVKAGKSDSMWSIRGEADVVDSILKA